MATYVIGDVHGCLSELEQLLRVIDFSTARDRLLFTGDLINGGKQSIETLQFVRSLKDRAVCVLGNHDLTLIGFYKKAITVAQRDICYTSMLAAPEIHDSIGWLEQQPLAYFDAELKILLIHAGLYPFWSLAKGLSLIKEVETVIKSGDNVELFRNLFGNNPTKWRDDLSGWERLRFIINATTRMRFCDIEGNLDFSAKGTIQNAPPGLKPWFELLTPNQHQGVTILFGHWSALSGVTNSNDAVNLDTGCVWGNALTALRLEDKQRFAVACTQYGGR
jgi:bis(5'-nucleosyl)-tetraphosphatase (symmetrical)